jgi:hypothetical protein
VLPEGQALKGPFKHSLSVSKMQKAYVTTEELELPEGEAGPPVPLLLLEPLSSGSLGEHD